MIIGDTFHKGEKRIALAFYTVDNGLTITEITINGSRVEVDDFSFVRLKKQCMEHYFNEKNRAIKAASDYRKNPR